MTAETLRARAQAGATRTDKKTEGHGAEVATRDDEPTLAQLVVQLKPELAHALPRHISVDRVARIAVTALRRTPALNRCSPASFLGALMTAAQLGLEVNTPAGEAYLIPYGNECTLVVGYQGIVKLFWQHPQAKHIDAQAVYEKDHFEYEYGLTPRLEHKPATGDRGKVITYYAVATLSNGGSAFVVLTPEEVKALRQGKVGPSGNIADPQRWMEKKTALKQMLKLLPKTVELTVALAADEQVRENYTATLDAIEVRPSVVEIEAHATDPEPASSTVDVPPAERAGRPKPQADYVCSICGVMGEHIEAACPQHPPLDVPEPTADELAAAVPDVDPTE